MIWHCGIENSVQRSCRFIVMTAEFDVTTQAHDLGQSANIWHDDQKGEIVELK